MVWCFLSEPVVFKAPAPGATARGGALAFDGSIILCAQKSVYHFASDGHLIRVLGKPGNGPGGFSRIGGAIWDGKNYRVYDSHRDDMSIFDVQGDFLARRYYPCRRLFFVDGTYFFINHEAYFKKDPSLKALTRVTFDNKFFVKSKQEFHDYLPIIFNYTPHINIHFFAKFEGELYTVCQVSPLISVYDDKLSLLRTFKAKMDVYVEPTPRAPGMNSEALRADMRLSFINNMFRVSDYIGINFYGPVVDELPPGVFPNKVTFYTQLVDRSGAPISSVITTAGPCMGAFKNRLLFSRELYEREANLYWEDLPLKRVKPAKVGHYEKR